MEGRSNHLDFLKGLLIILVVCFHTLEGLNKSNINVFYLSIEVANFLTLFIMPCFVFISGVLSHSALAARGNGKFFSKSVNFFYLYIVWSLIIYIFRLSLSSFTNTKIDPIEIIYILWDSMPTIWYIYVIFLCFITTKLLLSCELNKFLIVIFFTVLSYINQYHPFLDSNLIFVRFFWVYPYFLIGAFWPSLVDFKKSNASFDIKLFIIFFFTFIVYVVAAIDWLLILPLSSFLVTFSFFYGFRYFSDKFFSSKFVKFISYIGSISLFIYLVHFPFPSFSRILLNSLNIYGVAVLLLAVSLSLTLGHLAYLSRDKFFLRRLFSFK